MITDSEAVDIKSSLVILSNAHIESAAAQTELSKQIAAMLLEMKERDVRDEYLKLEIKEIKERQSKALDFAMPIARRAKKEQDARDRLMETMNTSWARNLAGALTFALGVGVLVIIAQSLGMDLSNLYSK